MRGLDKGVLRYFFGLRVGSAWDTCWDLLCVLDRFGLVKDCDADGDYGCYCLRVLRVAATILPN